MHWQFRPFNNSIISIHLGAHWYCTIIQMKFDDLFMMRDLDCKVEAFVINQTRVSQPIKPRHNIFSGSRKTLFFTWISPIFYVNNNKTSKFLFCLSYYAPRVYEYFHLHLNDLITKGLYFQFFFKLLINDNRNRGLCTLQPICT